MPVNLDDVKVEWAMKLRQLAPDYFKKAQILWAFPLNAGGGLLGLMTLSDRISRVPFSTEDLDLLKTISCQLAGSLYNLKLSDQVRQAREMEAFQTVSAFMMHDLKNLASRLSLTVENFPTHFDNPEFRKDALNVISQSGDEDKQYVQSSVHLESKNRVKSSGNGPKQIGKLYAFRLEWVP